MLSIIITHLGQGCACCLLCGGAYFMTLWETALANNCQEHVHKLPFVYSQVSPSSVSMAWFFRCACNAPLVLTKQVVCVYFHLTNNHPKITLITYQDNRSDSLQRIFDLVSHFDYKAFKYINIATCDNLIQFQFSLHFFQSSFRLTHCYIMVCLV